MHGQADLGHGDAGHHPSDVAGRTLRVDEAVQAVADVIQRLELPLHSFEQSDVAVETEALGHLGERSVSPDQESASDAGTFESQWNLPRYHALKFFPETDLGTRAPGFGFRRPD